MDSNFNAEDKDERAVSAWRSRRLSPLARCAQCGSDEITCLPTFAVGAGIAYRPVANDVYCRRCGYIGEPELAPLESSPQQADNGG